MKMKLRTNTGKVDRNFDNIKVGDTLLPLVEGLKRGVVDSYGTLVTESGKISPKDWDGADYTIKAEEEIESANEAPSLEDGGLLDCFEDCFEEPTSERGGGSKTKEEWPMDNGLSLWSSPELVTELRARGYEVVCKRTIVEEL